MNDVLSAQLRQAANDHIDKLARKYKITVRRTKLWYNGEAAPEIDTVFISKDMRSGIDYLGALHEMAHIVCPSAGKYATSNERYDDHVGARMKIEAAAWAWALEKALPELVAACTKTDLRDMGRAWATAAGPAW